MNTLADHIAGEIRAEMARRRLNQTRMAERLGMSQAAFSRALNGKAPMTRPDLPKHKCPRPESNRRAAA